MSSSTDVGCYGPTYWIYPILNPTMAFHSCLFDSEGYFRGTEALISCSSIHIPEFANRCNINLPSSSPGSGKWGDCYTRTVLDNRSLIGGMLEPGYILLSFHLVLGVFLLCWIELYLADKDYSFKGSILPHRVKKSWQEKLRFSSSMINFRNRGGESTSPETTMQFIQQRRNLFPRLMKESLLNSM